MPTNVGSNDNSDSKQTLDDARIEAIVRRVQLSPTALIDSSKEQLNAFIRAAIADTAPTLTVAQVESIVDERAAAERAARTSFVDKQLKEHIAAKHVPEVAAIDEKIAALERQLSRSASSGQPDDAAVRALIVDTLNKHDALSKAQHDAANAVATAERALAAAKQKQTSGAASSGDATDVKTLIEQYVQRDVVGRPDWALNLAGAVVLPQTSKPFYTPITEVISSDLLFICSLKQHSNTAHCC